MDKRDNAYYYSRPLYATPNAIMITIGLQEKTARSVENSDENKPVYLAGFMGFDTNSPLGHRGIPQE